MPQSTIEVPEGRSEISFDLNATMKNGIQLPVEVFIVYPEGNGLHAINVVARAMQTQTGGMFQELLNRQDASIIQAMLERSADNDEDDEL